MFIKSTLGIQGPPSEAFINSDVGSRKVKSDDDVSFVQLKKTEGPPAVEISQYIQPKKKGITTSERKSVHIRYTLNQTQLFWLYSGYIHVYPDALRVRVHATKHTHEKEGHKNK